MNAIVQIRGPINMNGDVVDTLEMLNLGAVNHATLVPETETYRGMITKVNDYVAFGTPSADTLATIIERRGEPTRGDTDIDDAWVADNTDYESVTALAEALAAEETGLKDQGLSPTLRLHPPRGGHNGIKHAVKEGGEIGRHPPDAINNLLEAMR
jgi:50S ribosomal protein L30P, archaeal